MAIIDTDKNGNKVIYRATSPIAGLPPVFGQAVHDVSVHIQAPLDMVIASALGAISLVCQDEIDVETGSGLISPCSLFFMTIAESGDRKSTVDRLFIQPIVEFEEEGEKEYQEQLFLHNSKMEAWNILHKKILSVIKKADAVGETFDQLNIDLHNHNRKKPIHPRKRKLLYSNATPESIVYGMHRNSPSAGILSDEAGGILNGQTMNDLAMLNQLWDGSTLTVDRKTLESFSLKDARLTISLMTQEKSMRKFIQRGDSIARGIGFLARCLVIKVDSMQGSRFLTNQSHGELKNINGLNSFQLRLKTILEINHEIRLIDKKIEINKKRQILKLSPEAKSEWLAFYNLVENELQPQGAFFSIKDAASKIAQNAARLAAIFHCFENNTGDISKDSMDYGVGICKKYMSSFKNLFGDYGYFSDERQNMLKLVNWIKFWRIAHLNAIEMPKNHMMQYGPLRKGSQLDKAINYLEINNGVLRKLHLNTEIIQFNIQSDFFK